MLILTRNIVYVLFYNIYVFMLIWCVEKISVENELTTEDLLCTHYTLYCRSYTTKRKLSILIELFETYIKYITIYL